MIEFDLSKWKLDPSYFKKNEERNTFKTGFGKVFFSIYNRKCAILHTNEQISHRLEGKFFKSIFMHILANGHPAIVPFVGFYIKNDFGYTVLEEKDEALSNLISKFREGKVKTLFDATHRLIIMYGISCAMEFLHNKSIVHRDIKPSHILLDSEFHPFLSGFHFAEKIQTHKSIYMTENFLTTPLYMAPELIKDPEIYSNSLPIDVYSYGITIYELLTYIKPFSHLKAPFQIFSSVSKGERPKIPSSVPSQYADLIKSCWAENPQCRPTFTEICDLLESDEFLTEDIDRNVFESYKKLVYPFRPSKEAKKIDENANLSNSQKEVDSSKEKEEESKKIINNLTDQLKEAENKIKDLQKELLN